MDPNKYLGPEILLLFLTSLTNLSIVLYFYFTKVVGPGSRSPYESFIMKGKKRGKEGKSETDPVYRKLPVTGYSVQEHRRELVAGSTCQMFDKTQISDWMHGWTRRGSLVVVQLTSKIRGPGVGGSISLLPVWTPGTS